MEIESLAKATTYFFATNAQQTTPEFIRYGIHFSMQIEGQEKPTNFFMTPENARKMFAGLKESLDILKDRHQV